MSGRSWDDLNRSTYDDFIEYGMFDILALGELYVKLNNIIQLMDKKFIKQFGGSEEDEKIKINDILTIGSYVYSKMIQFKKDNEFNGIDID